MTEFEHAGWAIAVFETRCDEHMGPIPAGTPYKLHRLPGRMRRVCRDCADVTTLPSTPAAFPVSNGSSPCGWCDEIPEPGQPWTTVKVATAESRACLDCWSRWDQGLPLRKEAQ